MSFVKWVEHQRRGIVFVAFALTIAGIFAGISLPVGLFPIIDFPRIRVEVDAGSMPAAQMLIDVTEPLEEVGRAVPGAIDISSTTSRGSAEMFIDFPWGADMKQALLSVDAAFAQKLPDLPKGTGYDIIQMSPNAVMPFVSYALISDSVSPAALRHLATYQITPMLTGIAGIRRIGVLGGKTPEVEVSVSPQTLQSYGLTIADVSAAISQTNDVNAVGRIEDNALLYLVVNDNEFDSVASVRNVALHTGQGRVVLLGDIAKVEMGTKPQWLMVNENGQPAVTFDVFQQDNADAVSLAKEVGNELSGFMKTQPKSIRLYKWYDQTDLVNSSIAAVEEAIVIGLAFAALVMLAFLRNWRVTMVAMVIVLMSVMTAILLLSVLGMTFNIMTLGGIAAAIGLLIDDVIVMIEHIARRAGVPGLENPQQTVLHAAREFMSPLSGSSLATIIIFVPLAFLSGITGAFFKFLSLTMASTLIISYGMTALVSPLLSRWSIDFAKWHDPSHGRETWTKRAHRRVLRTFFAFPWLIGVGVTALVVVGYIGFTHVGSGFLPQMDEGGFVLDYKTAPGTSLAETNRELAEVEGILKKDPTVYTYSRRTGAGLGGDLNESYQGDFFVRLVDPSKRPPISLIMDRLSSEVTSQVPGVDFDTHQLMSDLIGDMVGRRQPVVITLSGSNPSILPDVAGKVAKAIAKVPGIEPASVDSGVVPAGDALDIRIDPPAAALMGVTAADVKSQLDSYLQGDVVTSFLNSQQDIGVRLWVDTQWEQIHRNDLNALPIRASDGRIFPLTTVAKISFVAGQPQLTRDKLQQVVPVTAVIGGGHDLGSTITNVKKILDKPGFIPAGVNYELGGEYKQQQLAISGMARVAAAAIVAEIVLLLFLYQGFLIPIIILVTSLISVSAVFIGLWVTHIELNITAMMGMVMILGIATEMAIFLVSEYKSVSATMPVREALYEAALNRLRPITMSTLAMILALVPLGAAISGSGDQMLQPLAITIIAGVIVQLPLVLVALPVMIGWVERDRQTIHGSPQDV